MTDRLLEGANGSPVQFAYSYDGSLVPPWRGMVPAMWDWNDYASIKEKVVIAKDALLDPDRYDHFGPVTGIDAFLDTARHEQGHVVQVYLHDQLEPYDVSIGLVRTGWSWFDNGEPWYRYRSIIANGRYNHFSAGIDLLPGLADFDDDFDSVDDDLDEFIAGPSNSISVAGTIVGDDIDLDPDGDLVGVTGDLYFSDPDQSVWPTYQEIIEAACFSLEHRIQDNSRTVDWANPGKQHGPNIPTSAGEINSYAD